MEGLLCLHLGENFTLIYSSIHPSPLFMHLTMWYLFVCLSVCLFACLFPCLFVCLFVCLFLWNLQHFVQPCIHQGFKFDRTSRYNSAKNGHWSSWWHLWNQHEMLRICFRAEYFTGFILSFLVQEGMTNDTVDEQNPKNQLRSDETSPLNGILYQLASTVSLSETFKSNWMFPKIVVHPNHPF